MIERGIKDPVKHTEYLLHLESNQIDALFFRNMTN